MKTKKEQVVDYIEKTGFLEAVNVISKNTGVSERHIRDVIKEYGLNGKYEDASDGPKNTFFAKGDTATWNYVGPGAKIHTLEDALAVSNVNLDIWKVEKYSIEHNAWDMSYKGLGKIDEVKSKDGRTLKRTEDWEARTATNQQVKVKVFFKLKKEERVIEDCMRISIEEMEKHSPEYKPIAYKKQKNSCLALVSLVDCHIGKLALEEECGENYNTDIGVKIRDWAIDEAVNDLAGRSIHKILYVTGNDDIHIDNKNSTTTSGTGVDCDNKYSRLFEAVKHSHIRAVDLLRRVAPVQVVSMPGNHDETLAYFMGQVLAAWYRNCKEVAVDYSPAPQKYYRDGITMFMITHGRHEKRANLPIIMATDEPEMWSKAKCREVITGDLHHKKDTNYIGTEDMQGITVRILPTLSGLDRWHKERGYRSVRAADIFYYDKDYGLDGLKHIPVRKMK